MSKNLCKSPLAFTMYNIQPAFSWLMENEPNCRRLDHCRCRWKAGWWETCSSKDENGKTVARQFKNKPPSHVLSHFFAFGSFWLLLWLCECQGACHASTCFHLHAARRGRGFEQLIQTAFPRKLECRWTRENTEGVKPSCGVNAWQTAK